LSYDVGGLAQFVQGVTPVVAPSTNNKILVGAFSIQIIDLNFLNQILKGSLVGSGGPFTPPPKRIYSGRVWAKVTAATKLNQTPFTRLINESVLVFILCFLPFFFCNESRAPFASTVI
jgi:hypothetical protein